jgi:hypothetical protein
MRFGLWDKAYMLLVDRRSEWLTEETNGWLGSVPEQAASYGWSRRLTK